MIAQTTHWIAVDWGSSKLRAYRMEYDGNLRNTVIEEKTAHSGLAKIESNSFEAALLELISRWLSNDFITPVIACGMVGARQGWIEAPYRYTPCRLIDDVSFTNALSNDERMDVFIAPGLAQAEAPDVMRGEETQVAGLLSIDTEYRGWVCLPGTHSKWVRIEDQKIIRFETHMTGELYSLLSTQSILQHSIDETDDQTDLTSFVSAARQAIESPNKVSAMLFSIRANHLLNNVSSVENAQVLSGYLVGLELSATQAYWHDSSLFVVGDPLLASRYAAVLQSLSVNVLQKAADDMTLAGLGLLYQQRLNANSTRF